MLTQEYLKSQVLYEPDTGQFYWLVPKRGRKLDKPISYGVKYGGITLDGVTYQCHVLAFFYMTGRWPKELVDHEDGNSLNNRWSNLREATHAQNAANRRRRRSTLTGVKGVAKNYRNDTWNVTVDKDGKRHSLGPFFSLREAHKAHQKLSKELFGEFHRKEIPRIQKGSFSVEDLKKALEEYKNID